MAVVYKVPIALVVLRTILGFTPPEWANVASQRTKVPIDQGAARTIDRRVRMNPDTMLVNKNSLTDERVRALVITACELLNEGAPNVDESIIHRLNKPDTSSGLASLKPLANLGVPYPILLYERFLGRPFAGHRDSVSELVGDVLETAIEEILHRNGVSYRKTKRAERIPNFDQAPDFIIPNEFNPQVVIEAKVTEDDGTARDKVTRVQHLATLSEEGMPAGQRRYEVVACIAGRGFGVRKEDMKKLLLATHGKVFTAQNIQHLVEHTKAATFKTR